MAVTKSHVAVCLFSSIFAATAEAATSGAQLASFKQFAARRIEAAN
jgi:hypothetical protein